MSNTRNVRFRADMAAMRMSHGQLADEAGCSVSLVSRWFSDKSVVPWEVLHFVARRRAALDAVPALAWRPRKPGPKPSAQAEVTQHG